MYRGASTEIEIDVENSAGESVDITGGTVSMTVKRMRDANTIDEDDSLAVFKKDVTEHTSAASGQSLIKIEPEDTRAMQIGEHYVYSINITLGEGSVSTLASGDFQILQNVENRVSLEESEEQPTTDE